MVSRKLLLSGSSDDVSNTINHAGSVFDNGRTISLSKAHTSSGETTKHGSPTELLFSSSSGTNNGTDAVKDSWNSAEETEEKLLLLRGHLLQGLLLLSPVESTRDGTKGTSEGET